MEDAPQFQTSLRNLFHVEKSQWNLDPSTTPGWANSQGSSLEHCICIVGYSDPKVILLPSSSHLLTSYPSLWVSGHHSISNINHQPKQIACAAFGRELVLPLSPKRHPLGSTVTAWAKANVRGKELKGMVVVFFVRCFVIMACF